MKRLLIASMLIAATATPAMAGVGKVSTPKVTKGEAEVEYNATRTGDGGKSLNNAQKHKIEFEYGITDD